MMIKAIIFDCFGVLYPDTLALVVRPHQRRGLQLDSAAIRDLRLLSDSGRISRDEFWDGIASYLQISRAQLDAELNTVQKADWELLEYIKQLKKTYKTAILSNVGKGFIERIFTKQQPIEDYFDVVSKSYEIGVLKPDPRAFEITLEHLGVAPDEAVFIDDVAANTDSAKLLGMHTILYSDFDTFKEALNKTLA